MADPGRIYFVLTLQGERGPFDRSELREQLRDGAARPEDRVRNAFGRQLGSVADVLARRTSEPRPAAVAVAAAEEPSPRRRPALALLLAAAAAAIVAAFFVLGRGPGDAPANPPPATPPAAAATAAPVPPAAPATPAAPAAPTTPAATPAVPSAATSGGLPPGWSVHDIGCPKGPAVSVAQGSWLIPGAGDDIAGVSDQFRFVAAEAAADAVMTVRITAFSCHSGTSKAGIMLRAGTAPNAPFVAVCLTVSGQAMRWARTTAGAGATPAAIAANVKAPHWLRLTRQDGRVTAYHSPNGREWSAIGDPVAFTADVPVLAGVAVASRDRVPRTVVLQPPQLEPAPR